jgi:hypothetical protein
VKFKHCRLEIKEDIEKANGIRLCSRDKLCNPREDFAECIPVRGLKYQQHCGPAVLSQISGKICLMFGDGMDERTCRERRRGNQSRAVFEFRRLIFAQDRINQIERFRNYSMVLRFVHTIVQR